MERFLRLHWYTRSFWIPHGSLKVQNSWWQEIFFLENKNGKFFSRKQIILNCPFLLIASSFKIPTALLKLTIVLLFQNFLLLKVCDSTCIWEYMRIFVSLKYMKYTWSRKILGEPFHVEDIFQCWFWLLKRIWIGFRCCKCWTLIPLIHSVLGSKHPSHPSEEPKSQEMLGDCLILCLVLPISIQKKGRESLGWGTISPPFLTILSALLKKYALIIWAFYPSPTDVKSVIRNLGGWLAGPTSKYQKSQSNVAHNWNHITSGYEKWSFWHLTFITKMVTRMENVMRIIHLCLVFCTIIIQSSLLWALFLQFNFWNKVGLAFNSLINKSNSLWFV